MKKRSLCLVLAMVILLAMAMTASAAWDGVTSADPTWNEAGQCYEISTPEQLAGMRDWINAGENNTDTDDYCLMANIDLGGNEWTPIEAFRGKFDGTGYTVSNFKITSVENRTLTYIGLFGHSYGGIQNTGVTGFVIDIQDSRLEPFADSLVGYNDVGVIENCFSVGTISVHSPSGSIMNVGGLVGYNSQGGDISKSFAAVKVSSSTYGTLHLGGFVGHSAGHISESYATGKVTGQVFATPAAYVGGFMGVNNHGGMVEDCYATGDVKLLASASMLSDVGGFAGYNYDASDIASSYSYGAVSADAPSDLYWDGFVGRNNTGSSFSAYCGWNSTANTLTNGIGKSETNANVVLMTAAEMMAKANFTGWDFDNIWCYTMLDNEAKPALRAFFSFVNGNGVASKLNANVITFSPAPVTIDGAGTYTVNVYAAGYDIDSIALDTSNLADGVTATVNGNTITVTVRGSAANAIDCTLGVTVTINGEAQPTKTLTITTGSSEGGSTPGSYGSGGSSGYSAGFGATALLSLLGLAVVVKRK